MDFFYNLEVIAYLLWLVGGSITLNCMPGDMDNVLHADGEPLFEWGNSLQGKRKEGAYLAALNFALKSATYITLILNGVVQDIFRGYLSICLKLIERVIHLQRFRHGF